MGSGVTNFTSIIEAKSLGTADIDKMTAAIDKQTASLDNLGKKATTVSQHPGFNDFAAKVKAGIQDPLGTAGEFVEGFLTKLGPVGAIATGAAVGLGVIGKYATDAARQLGSLGDQIEDTASRMGLTTAEVQQFSLAMKFAGGDMGTLEGVMRKLSQEIDSGGKNLDDIGVKFRDVRTGAVRPMSDVILQLSERLGAIPEVAARNSAAIRVMGRAALDVLPDLLELPESLQRAQKSALVFTTEELAGFKKLHQEMVEVDNQWDKIVMRLKQGITIPINWLLSDDFDPSRDKSVMNPIRRNGELAPGSPLGSMMGYKTDLIGDALKAQIAKDTASMMQQALAPFISANDARVASAVAPTSLDERLTAARKKLGDLRGNLKTGVLPEVNSGVFADIAAQQQVISSLEGQKKAIEDSKKAFEELTRALDVELKARDDRQARYSNKLIEGEIALGQVSTGGMPAWIYNELQAGATRQINQGFANPLRYHAPDNLSDIQQLLASGAASELRGVQFAGAQSIGFSGLRGALSGSSEGKQVSDLYALRKNYAEAEYELTKRNADAEETLKQKLFEADMDRGRALLEIALRQKEAFQNLAVNGINSLIDGNGGGFLKSQGRGLLDRVIGNGAGMAWSSVSSLIPHASEGSTLGKLLNGTAFGADPLKAATSANTMATIDNTMALRAMAMSASGGGGGVVGAAGDYLSWAAGAATSAGGGTGVSDYAKWAGIPSKTSSLARGVGIAAAGGAAAYGAYQGFSHGDVMGDISGAGSLIGGASSILSLVKGVSNTIPLIGTIVGTALAFLPMLMGDPKVKRAREIDDNLNASRYTGPTANSYTMDRYGRGIDYDTQGNMRPIVINNIFQTTDAKSFSERIDQHSADIASSLGKAIENREATRAELAIRSVVTSSI